MCCRWLVNTQRRDSRSLCSAFFPTVGLYSVTASSLRPQANLRSSQTSLDPPSCVTGRGGWGDSLCLVCSVLAPGSAFFFVFFSCDVTVRPAFVMIASGWFVTDWWCYWLVISDCDYFLICCFVSFLFVWSPHINPSFDTTAYTSVLFSHIKQRFWKVVQ